MSSLFSSQLQANLHKVDQRRNLIIPGDASRTIQFCATHLVSTIQEILSYQDFFAIALSGGSTPKAIFETLTHSPYKEAIPWDRLLIFWSDERSVPKDHIDSNYYMAMQAGFSKMPIPENHIFRMQAEKDIDHQASKYEETIKRFIPQAIFDYIMLGMGDDGHTASLFPHTHSLKCEDRLVNANYVPEKNTWRMTLTYPCINSAKTCVFYVIGSSKKEMLKKVLEGPYNPELLPSQKVGTAEHPALWIADQEAASLLKK